MVRQCERTIDYQFQGLKDLDDKTRHVLALGVAALGAAFALATFAIDRGLVAGSRVFVGAMGVSIVLNLVSLLYFAASYLGFQRSNEFHAGPSLVWIAKKSNESTWTLADHYLSVIRDFPSYVRWNRQRLLRASGRRHVGLLVLLAAAASYASAFGYILWRTI